MGQPFIGEIRMLAFGFTMAGWEPCDGQLLPISENDALFTLIGTTYGGDGQETFALPNLQSRIPIKEGPGPDGVTYILGEAAGTESVTLTTNQIPVHSHPALASTTGQVQSPTNAVLATATSTQTGMRIYSTQAPTTSLHPSSISPAGGSQPHENMQPYLVVNYQISLFGVFPSTT